MSPTLESIAANIALIEQRLTRARNLAREAIDAIHCCNQNRAIGTLLPVQEDLADIDALLKTVLLLHRARHEDEPKPPRRGSVPPDPSLQCFIEEWGSPQDLETYRYLLERAGIDKPQD